MLESLLLILPVFLIIAFGVALDVGRVLPRNTGSVIGAYVLYVALPILMLHLLAGAGLDDILHGGFWAGLVAAQLTVYGLGYAGEFLLARRGHAAAAVTALSASCANVAFIGFPVVVSLMPGNHEALIAAGLAVITPNVVAIPCQVQLEFLKRAQGRGGGLAPMLAKAVLLNPLMLGMCGGFLLGGSGLGLWGPLDKAAELIGNTTAPCMLLALGLDLRGKYRVAALSGKGLNLPRLGGVGMLKLVVHPLLTWWLMDLLGVGGTWLVVGVIMSGTATALVSYVIAEIYDAVPEEVALTAVVTNVLNLVTITVLASIFRGMGLL